MDSMYVPLLAGLLVFITYYLSYHRGYRAGYRKAAGSLIDLGARLEETTQISKDILRKQTRPLNLGD